MSDMTIESAKKCAALPFPVPCSLEELHDRSLADGFILGHASRDPEVEKLKVELQMYTTIAEQNTVAAQHWKREATAEREASRKLVEAAKEAMHCDGRLGAADGLCRGCLRRIEDAIKSYTDLEKAKAASLGATPKADR